MARCNETLRGGAGGGVLKGLLGRRAALLALAFALVFACTAGVVPLAGKAYAVDSDENLVDPAQRADNSFIYDTTIESLIDQSSLYNNRTVQITGEVIGDRIEAEVEPGYCWVTMTMVESEDKASISVLMSDDLADQIDHYGKYGVTGTILQVRGTYHQTCDEHDGLPDIHASNASVLTRGSVHSDEFRAGDFVPGIVTVAVGLVMMAVFYFARERTR